MADLSHIIDVVKRDGVTVQPFDRAKVAKAILGAFADTGLHYAQAEFDAIVADVCGRAQSLSFANAGADLTVEQVGDLCERALMDAGRHAEAKAYILYREDRRRAREARQSIFGRRVAFKPFTFPEVARFKDAIQKSTWIVSHWNFHSDKQDFATRLTPVEQDVARRAILAISQVEVSVKRFWGKVGDRFPKPEIEQVGAVFAESEVRHADAYSHLLTVLNLNDDFAEVLKVPAIAGRVKYLTDALRASPGTSDREYAMVLTLFSLFVENVSLFSQFAILKSLNKHRNVLKDVDNVIQATAKEEQIHALFGAWLVNQVKAERPDWFDDEFWRRVTEMAVSAYQAEWLIIDWIFEAGDLPYVSKQAVKEFVINRMNQSLSLIGYPGMPFGVAPHALSELDWFDEELDAEVHSDFFHKRPVTYSRPDTAITADALFDD